MKTRGLIHRSIFAAFLVLGLFQGSANGRPWLVSRIRPWPNHAPAFARWLVCQSRWGVISTISTRWGGVPFGNVVSFSDGLPNMGSGVPYFYVTPCDPTAIDAMKDERSSLTLSEYSLGTCGGKDPGNPACAKITLIGKLREVMGNCKEEEFARKALFIKHPEMRTWPKDFKLFRLDIEEIYLMNWFGGPKPLNVEDYFYL